MAIGSDDQDDTAASLLDALPVSPFQIAAVVMIAATVLLDGLDNQMLGLAAPALIREWGIPKQTLGLIFALGFVGMAIGTLAAGSIGDRYGRRAALLFGVVTFGVATALTGLSTSIVQIGALKTLAGVGLGGVPGTAAAMIAEFMPRRWRSLAVAAGVVCVSAGGILGGLAAAMILPGFGWRGLFYFGGAITGAFLILLWFSLPESPRFLAARPDRAAELAHILRRMGHSGHTPAPDTAAHIMRNPQVPIGRLFARGLFRDTIALSLAMFTGMFMIYLMFNWAPTLLFSAGFALDSTSLGLTAFNIGGTIGALAAGALILRLGSRSPLILMALSGAAICLYLALLPIAGGRNQMLLLTGLCAMGVFASGAQSAIFAVGAHAFPTEVRARGMGVMGAAGRMGAILSAVSGATLIAAGAIGLFGALTLVMLVNAGAFVLMRRHVPRPAHAAALPKPIEMTA